MVIQDANLNFGYVGKRNITEYIILHHSAGSGNIEAVHNYHKGLGWAGIGYNFYIRRDGSVWKGRGIDAIGTHTKGNYNYRSIGICAEGNFQNEKMSEAQKKSLIELVAYIWAKYPNVKIIGHRDADATACPGANFPMAEIINGARALKNSSIVSPPPTPIESETPQNETDNKIFKPLKKGSKGSRVKAVQILLIGYGYNCGKWKDDGHFGAATEKAVKAFQKDSGLNVDGICGEQTYKKLLGIT